MRRNKDNAGDGIPDFFTIEEAAAILRIGRTVAYELARRYLATGGAEGLPVVRVGHQLRVPRAALEAWAGGPITYGQKPASAPLTAIEPASASTPARARRSRGADQPTFPFSA